MPITPRQLAHRALKTWAKGREFSDEIFDTLVQSASLTARDRGFARELFFGVLRHLSELDFRMDLLSKGKLDETTRQAIRLGLYQLFYLRVPEHAAVNESVALAGKSRGLVNAVLRRAQRERTDLDAKLKAAHAEIQTSHPAFLLERWERQFGAENVQALCTWNNTPAEVYVRANQLKVTTAELLKSSSDAQVSPAHGASLKVGHLPESWMLGGLCYVQDPSTLMACDLLAPRPGERVLDACAAPGGKTSYMAELMGGTGHIVACDLYETRVQRLRENIGRLGIRNAHPIICDMMRDLPATPPKAVAEALSRPFDRILIDAPCSNTGVIRRRVDVRWRLTEEDFMRMPPQQLALIRRCASLLRPGGTLVYGTCSIEAEENEQVAEAAAKTIPELELVECRKSLPFKDGIDGAFAALFRRRES